MMREMPTMRVAAAMVSGMLTAMLVACGGNNPPPPSSSGPGNPSGDIQVSGGERLGWSQTAANASELATFQYAIYVDGTRSVLSGASCGGEAGTAGFECSAPLPVMAPGAHTIELAAFVVDGSVLESARSSALRVVVRGLTLSSGVQIDPHVVTAEQVRLNLQLIADGLRNPSDIAFMPDKTILVAERGGAIRIIREGELLSEPALDLSSEITLPAGGLLAIALDPQFGETGFVYTLTASQARRDGLAFVLARYRSITDRFGERAVLLDRVPASTDGAGGTARFGPDGKMYVALDDGANIRARGSLGSFNGKVLRLNPDASTPADQAGFSPIYSLDHPFPRALDWQRTSGDMWVVDTLEQTGGRLTAIGLENAKEKRGTPRQRYALPAGTGAASAAFYRGTLIPIFRDNLFVAAESGQHLIRLQFEPKNPEKVLSAERMLLNQVGPIRVVASGPDGGLYIANDTALFRLAP
jgi:aldose sugar dehydrogenase